MISNGIIMMNNDINPLQKKPCILTQYDSNLMLESMFTMQPLCKSDTLFYLGWFCWHKSIGLMGAHHKNMTNIWISQWKGDTYL